MSDVALAPLTTLELGGVADRLVELERVEDAREAVRWARGDDRPLAILGGGSNTVVADQGFRGTVLLVRLAGVAIEERRDSVRMTAAAGENWDALVQLAVAEGLAGLECLSGIPGSAGATPIQNVGAYGQEVSEVVEEVRVLDLGDLSLRSMTTEECAFAYRSSVFRRHPGRYLVLEVAYRLRRGGRPKIIYRELAELLGRASAAPSLADVRDAVLTLRRSKSMVADADDPNRRSVGSFFVNPLVPNQNLVRIAAAADAEVPAFLAGDGMVKIPAAWLIERAGFRRGLARGGVGISTAHTLAIVNRGTGSADELLALAREIRDGVRARFGIELRPEPVFIGFGSPNPLD